MQTKLIKTDIDENKIINSFKKDFLAIKKKGWVSSKRKHDTGIGKTFEDLVGIYENNNKLADYEDILEIKSKRKLSEAMITLFTMVPSSPKGVMRYIKDTYGEPDPNFSNQNIVHSTMSHSKFNKFKNKWGFKLEIGKTKKKIFLRIKNLNTGKIEKLDIFWTFESLKESLENKCKYIAYIGAKHEKEEGKPERFHFVNATILSGLTFKKFLKFIEKDLILYDIRYGVYQSGPKKGQSHDHGPGFRIAKRNLSKVFNMTGLE